MRKKSLLLVLFSLLCVSSSLTGCKGGPRVTLCISNPMRGGFNCVTPDDKDYFLPYQNSDNFIALSPNDARTFFEYCSTKGD